MPAALNLTADDLKHGVLPTWTAAVAAKYVIYDLFQRINKEQCVYILSKDGRVCSYPAIITRPRQKFTPCQEFSAPRMQVVESGLVSRDEMVFGWDSLRLDYWHSAFSKCRIFDDGSSNVLMAVLRVYGAIPLINWGTCAVDLDRAYSFLASMDALMGERTKLKILNIIDDPEDWGRMAAALNCLEDGSLRSILKVLSPFDGCRLLAPVAWQKMIEQVLPDVSSRDQGNLLPPKMAILDAYRDNPLLSKQEIRLMLYPNWSERQFGKHWSAASEIDPTMKRPGRRKAKS